jgi:hypothetical protein
MWRCSHDYGWINGTMFNKISIEKSVSRTVNDPERYSKQNSFYKEWDLLPDFWEPLNELVV